MSDQVRDPLIEEALRWLVVLRDPSAGEVDRRAFDLWRAADPAHEAAWRRAQEVWARADILAPAMQDRASSPPARRFWTRRRWLQAAAVSAVAIPVGLLLIRSNFFADFRTAAGERRTINLGDGSTIELAGASALSVFFSAESRRLQLVAGEAFFDVAPETRPFVVEAGGGRVGALGTAFDVKLGETEVTVAVSKHRVSVSIDGSPDMLVEQGQVVRYSATHIEPVQAADLGKVEAWRRGRLIFQDAPLGEVIADLERCRGGRIILTDARLRAMPVTAVFDIRQTDAALATIASTLPIRVRRFTDLLVVLSPKD